MSSFFGRTRRTALIGSLIRMSPVAGLDEITTMIWRAYGAGEIDEGEAQALAQMVENARGRQPWQRAGAEAMDDVDPPAHRPFIR